MPFSDSTEEGDCETVWRVPVTGDEMDMQKAGHAIN